MWRLLPLLALLACDAAPAHPDDQSPDASARDARTGFVASTHPVVQAQLATRFDTPRGRAMLRESLARREALEPLFRDALEEFGLPEQVLAVALVESGFRNLPPHPRGPSAGLWQFIGPTGRAYGLRVDAHHDERMDLERSTEAALTLLSDLHAEFDDWGLAFAAYNVGSKRVHLAIEWEGTDDVWTLIERGVLPTYAADVMAAAIAMDRDR